MGTWFSDKYAEGTIGHRFYAGCQNVDTVESVAAEHARELFGAPYAYAQPHSGIDANLVAFWSILAHRVEGPWLKDAGAKNVNDLTDEDWEKLRHELGNQRLLGMSLDAGGHLTHGFRPNISGKMFHQQQYGTDPETGLLDYDVVRAKAKEFKPLILVAGYSAYPRRVNFAKMREIADEVGATLMVDMAHFAGLVAGKVFTGDEDPVPHAHVVTTTTHKSLRGPRGGLVLAQEEFAPSVDRGCPMVLGGPLSHMMAAKAVALAEARQDSFRTYAQNIADNAKSLADGFLTRGADLVTGGTDNHLVLLDVSSFGLTGRQAESALLDAGLTTAPTTQALEVIASVEPRIADATRQELVDQRASLKLIASENYASPAVLLTMGTWFSDKYAEGTDRSPLLRRLPERRHRRVGRRRARARAVRRALRLRPAALRHRRQPRRLLVDPGPPRRGPLAAEVRAKNVNDLTDDDWEKLRHELGNQRLLGMSLDAGGHLTHGFRPNISGKMFHQQQYGTDPETGLLDYDAVARQGARVQAADPGRRLLGLPASRELRQHARDRRRGRRHADGRHGPLRRPGRRQRLHRRRDPVPHAHITTTTTTHKSLRGPRGGLVLAQEEYAPVALPPPPDGLGGPLSPTMAAKAVALRPGPAGLLPHLRPDIADNAKSLAEASCPAAPISSPTPPQPIVLLDVSSSASPAGRPSPPCSTPASSPTATRSRTSVHAMADLDAHLVPDQLRLLARLSR